MLRMEDGAKENTALNIQKPLEILVTDEDKHGTDIACMSDFFGIYIEQLSAELSNQVMRGVVEKIPAADVQILGELVHGVDVLLSGKYGYIPDFDSLPNDVSSACKDSSRSDQNHGSETGRYNRERRAATCVRRYCGFP